MSRFDGRVALVTGGSSGIGAAVAERLLREGAKVATLDLAEGGPSGALGLTGDVRKSEEIAAAVERAETELGPLAILVCSAGITGDSLRTVEVSDDEWRRVLAINADGTFFANRCVIPGMTERNYGRIVNIASIAGKEGNPMAAAYSSSKAAVIATPMLSQMSQEHVDYMIEKIPMRRMGQPDEVAELVAYLASERMTFSTGATFDISGGRAVF